MKKLIAVCAVLLFVAPAFAADWAFYGSERVGTWYTERDNGSSKNSVGGQVFGQGNDSAAQWNFQSNSRFGANVKADKVSGKIELRLANETSNYAATSGGDTGVGTRLAWGEWKFADNMSLKVGKMISTATDIISNQWYGDDADLLGVGNFYGKRPSGLELNIGNFSLGMFTPNSGGDVNNPAYAYVPANSTNATAANAVISGATNGETDAYLPKFEAKYKLDLGAGYIQPFGGFQWYQIKSAGNGATVAGNLTSNLDVYSYVAGVSTVWNIGAFTIGAQASYGMNEGSANWATNYANIGATNYKSSSRNVYLSQLGGSDTRNVFTTQAELVAALKFTDTLRFETGVGYTVDNANGAQGYSQKDDALTVYLQAMVTLAPGVFLCPEVGYIDYMNDRTGNDEGYQWYAGAKWQIDF